MIVGIPVALAIAVIYLRFVIELPAHIRRLFILAAISYIGGAVVIEAFSANMWFLNDGGSLPYMIVGSIEEFFEMMGVITLIYALLQYIRELQVNINLYPAADTTPDNRPPSVAAAAESPSRVTVILLLGGICLALMQWVLVRELSALPADNGLVAPIVVMTTLVTLFIGFNLSSWLPPVVLLASGAVSLLLHLTLPLWLRLLFLALEKIGGATLAWVLPSIVGAFLVSGFVSLFLPHFVQNNRKQIVKPYGALLLAAAGTMLALQLLDKTAAPVIIAAYTLGIAACMIALRLPRPVIGFFAAISLVWLMVYPHLDYSTNSELYQMSKGLPSGTKTLFSGYSRYQKVDILQSPEGDRYLYLNGQINFDSDKDSRFNIYLGKIPAMLVQPDNVLVLGAGSMHLERLLAEHAGHVTTVDKDQMLIEESLNYFDDFNRMSSLANRTIVIDYPERYIARTAVQYEMLSASASISGDSTAFYSAAAQILAPDGILVADLAGKFATQDEAPQQRAASLTNIFREVMILTPDGSDRSVAFAADRLPFTREALSNILQAQGEIQFTIFDPQAVLAIAGDQRLR
jgi:spermidine synthase